MIRRQLCEECDGRGVLLLRQVSLAGGARQERLSCPGCGGRGWRLSLPLGQPQQRPVLS